MPNSNYSEDVRQHLSFIQGVITRMNSNSFSMKGWMVAIISGLCAVYASNVSNPCSHIYFIVAIFTTHWESMSSVSSKQCGAHGPPRHYIYQSSRS